MKKLLISAAALIALSAAPAMAADMPVKGKVYDKMYDWSGFYIGTHTGYAWGESDWTFYDAARTARSYDFDNVVWGFHAGVQAQFGNWVIGAETAFSLPTDFNPRGNYVPCPTATLSCGLWNANDIFTAGLKLGYAWDKWLLAVNGGFARAQIHTRSFVIATGLLNDATTARHDGWYIGGSLEYVMHKGTLVDVIGGFDYQHIALDSNQHNPLTTPCVAGAGFCRDVDMDIDMVRARLTIKTKAWEIFYLPPATPVLSK
jgi:outer membrane immunogenic protein